MTYWIVSIGLISVGVIAILSIGRPFLMIGLALLVLRPLRGRPALFWPPLAAVVAWNAGFLAIAPFQCTATQTVGVGSAATGDATTVCSSLIGVTYSGQGVYNPSLGPANQVGLLLAVVSALVVLAVVLWVRKAQRL